MCENEQLYINKGIIRNIFTIFGLDLVIIVQLSRTDMKTCSWTINLESLIVFLSYYQGYGKNSDNIGKDNQSSSYSTYIQSGIASSAPHICGTGKDKV